MRTLAMIVFVSALAAAVVVFVLCLPAVAPVDGLRGAVEPAAVRQLELRDAATGDVGGLSTVGMGDSRGETGSVMGPGYNAPPPYVPVS